MTRSRSIADQYPVRRSAVHARAAPRAGTLRLAAAARRFARSPRRSSSPPPTARQSRASTTCSTSSRSAEHLVEICTNISCALVGAQQTLEAFERELGIAAGETTADGAITLRTLECAGGCSWAPVVVVDHRYREPVTADDVPEIVAELRG